MPILWPFKKYNVDDFADVFVPLAQTPPESDSIAGADTHDSFSSLNASEKGTATDEKVKADSTTALQSTLTLEALRREIDHDVSTSDHDSAYERKSKVINKAIEDIGMGRYQWELFGLCGGGWLADNLWLQTVALTLPSLTAEFGVSEERVRFTTLSLFVGLSLGSAFWGSMADIVGRRPVFNFTLMVCAIFGTAVGWSNGWVTVCSLFAAAASGVGGNLPVDGALLMEFLPGANSQLLTALSFFWPLGQLICSLVGWGFLTRYNCGQLPACSAVASGVECCTKSSNMGWRYLSFTMGAITFAMFIARFFFFHMFESPKFLLSRGRQREAVAVVRGIAYHNRTKTWLSEDVLSAIGGEIEEKRDQPKLSYSQILRRQLEKFSGERIKPLFADRKLGRNTCMLWFIWTAVGMGYPLFNAFLVQYLAAANPNTPPVPASVLYRNYAIESIVGLPGSIIAYYTVNIRHFGRRGTMATATLLTGLFVTLFTVSPKSEFQLALSCLVAFFQNIMYGVLFAYTPETFPAPNRGTGSGISSFLNRLAGLCAPVVAVYAVSGNPKVPIYVSGALILSAFLAMCGLPIETMGKQFV